MNRTLLFCFALAMPSFAAAETILATAPSTYTCTAGSFGSTGWQTSLDAVCAAGLAAMPAAYHAYGTYWTRDGVFCSFRWTPGSGIYDSCMITASAYTCPANQGWSLRFLDGAWKCTRPDCLNWQVRQADGSCGNPSCGGCAVFNTTTHLCDNTCFLPSQCLTVDGGTQCSTPDGVCRLR